MSAKFAALTAILSTLTFGGVWIGMGQFSVPGAAVTASTAEASAAIEQSVYYAGCNSVRAAGAAPLHRGTPGYREEMDGDGDGVACEPHRDGDGGGYGGRRGRRGRRR